MANFASSIWNSGPFAGQPLCALLPTGAVFGSGFVGQAPIVLNSEESPLFGINSAKEELDDAIVILNRATSTIMKKLAVAAVKEQIEAFKTEITKYEKTL